MSTNNTNYEYAGADIKEGAQRLSKTDEEKK